MAMPSRNNRKEDPSSPAEPQLPPSSSSSSSSSAADNFSAAPRTKPTTFPPGYKFVPSEDDLIVHYLKPFLRSNKNPPPNVPIHRVNIYDSNPERLSKEYVKGNDKEWFFITERTKMHEGRNEKQSRIDNGGFWKVRTALEKFKTRKGVAFSRTVLNHYMGKKQNGVKSEWVMYEYLTESSPRDKSNSDNKMVDYALCKIYMTPRGIKKKAEEVENEMKKNEKEEGEASQEVDQPCNPEVQQTHPKQPCPLSSDEFREMFNSHNLPDDFDGVFTVSIDLNQLDEDTESNNSCGLKKSSKKD
ncbi:hypothetical protein N665_0201s0347 [Sinapis alba]|nr:hypothetical protein N665_0201s0347 [Sinapis alba]